LRRKPPANIIAFEKKNNTYQHYDLLEIGRGCRQNTLQNKNP
jgi:hypothetical protein